jgi:hypothetical protein
VNVNTGATNDTNSANNSGTATVVVSPTPGAMAQSW